MSFRSQLLNTFYLYQLDEGRLIGSENPCLYPNPAQIAAEVVRAFQVRAIVSLVPDSMDFGTPEVTHYHHPLPNNGVPTICQVRDVIATITPHLQKGQVVWCHCQQGIDRTGCVLGGILAGKGMPADSIIQQVTARFPVARQSPRLLALWKPYADIIRALSEEQQRGWLPTSTSRGTS